MAEFLINFKGCEREGFKRFSDELRYAETLLNGEVRYHFHTMLYKFIALYERNPQDWFIPDVPDVRKLTPEQSK